MTFSTMDAFLESEYAARFAITRQGGTIVVRPIGRMIPVVEGHTAKETARKLREHLKLPDPELPKASEDRPVKEQGPESSWRG